MKPVRTIDEATRLFKKANEDKRYHEWLFELTGTQEESKDRFESTNLTKKLLGPIEMMTLLAGGAIDPLIKSVLLPATFNTCFDMGVIVGQLMYLEELPEGLEEAAKVYVN